MYVSKKEIEVRYAETDQMGIVYHANYLIWMEVGRTALIKELGFSYAQLEADGALAPVIDLQVQYKKPLLYGETATVHTWIEEYNGSKRCMAMKFKNLMDKQRLQGQPHIFVSIKTPLDLFNLEKPFLPGIKYMNSRRRSRFNLWLLVLNEAI